MDVNLTKVCKRCLVEKPATPEYFYRARLGKGGLRAECKECKNSQTQIWRSANVERVRKTRRARYDANIEAEKEYTLNWNRNNRQRLLDRKKAYRLANQDKIKEQLREWRRGNPERVRFHTRLRKAKIRGAKGTFTQSDIDLIYKNQKGRCWWCNKKIKGTPHMDHRIPVSRGGSNNPSNIVLACAFCNQSKHDKLPHEWSDRLL